MNDTIDDVLRDRVLARLGLPASPSADAEGLARLYRAWCDAVPFDNVRKLIALRTRAPGPLPGIDPAGFFDAWLADGAGGTCWPGCNALFALLVACGFDVRRASASMGDSGEPNHGTIVARTPEGAAWIVDSSMLTGRPLRIDAKQRTVLREPPVHAEVEPVAGEDRIRIHFSGPGREGLFPCGLLEQGVDAAFFAERWEATRAGGPFNERLYLRRHLASGEVIALIGPEHHRLTAAGVESRRLDAAEVKDVLVEEAGLSPAIVESFESSGALATALTPRE